MSWQPIDTAPKNTDVLVAVDHRGDETWMIGVASYHTYAERDGGWWQWDWQWDADPEIYPKFWMPLPDPPSSRERGDA